MDKVTQAMVANKAAALKSDVKSFGGLMGEEDDEKREKQDTKRRHNSLRDMEERREKARQDRENTHRKREEEREKIRSHMRNKYKLKGSEDDNGSYGIKEEGTEQELSKNSEEISIQEDNNNNCSLQ